MHNVTQDELDRYSWFHGIDFGNGLSVKGRIPETQPQNYTLFGIYSFLEHIDLKGCRVVDIGTMDGLMAFILKKRGGGPGRCLRYRRTSSQVQFGQENTGIRA